MIYILTYFAAGFIGSYLLSIFASEDEKSRCDFNTLRKSVLLLYPVVFIAFAVKWISQAVRWFVRTDPAGIIYTVRFINGTRRHTDEDDDDNEDDPLPDVDISRPVAYETAKLLKDAGFPQRDILCGDPDLCYCTQESHGHDSGIDLYEGTLTTYEICNMLSADSIEAPELGDAIGWMEENGHTICFAGADEMERRIRGILSKKLN